MTTIVVPCYNETARFPAQKFVDFARQVPDFKFLFVDDGSTDSTFQMLDNLKHENPKRFDVLKLDRNSGKAEAVRQGFLSAIKDPTVQFIGFWDADLATPLKLLPDFMKIFFDHKAIEMVWGARVKLMGRNIKRRVHRHYLGRIFATCVSLALNLKIYDTQCGAKIFRVTNTLKNIFANPFRSRWIFDVEILARYVKEKQISSNQAESLIYELPLSEWEDVAGSKIQLKDYFVAFSELVRIYLAYRI